MRPDYKHMQVGERKQMPAVNEWAGENQDLYYEIQDYCRAAEHRPQFEVETVRPSRTRVEFWLKRTR